MLQALTFLIPPFVKLHDRGNQARDIMRLGLDVHGHAGHGNWGRSFTMEIGVSHLLLISFELLPAPFSTARLSQASRALCGSGDNIRPAFPFSTPH